MLSTGGVNERLDHLIAEVSAGASEADAVEPSLTLSTRSRRRASA